MADIKKNNSVDDGVTVESSKHVNAGSMLLKVLGIILSLLIIVSVVRTLNGNGVIPSFYSLLLKSTDIPVASIPFLNITSTTLGDWGVFNFFREFLSVLLGSVDIIIFLLNGLITLSNYVIIVVSWVFGV